MRCTPLVAMAFVACVTAPAPAQPAKPTPPARPEATSLLGVALYPPDPLPNREKLEADYRVAVSVANPLTAEAMIWKGRRLAYLWRYQDAIDAFTRGIGRYPDDARFYRHRGHRYITVRRFDLAVADLEKAAALTAGRPDEVEPDGAPNAAGKPRSTLHFNVWYHLGLAYYLQGRFEKALDAYVQCLKVSDNDDSVVAVSDWMWMTLMRLGRKADAARILDRITPEMDVIENQSYHRRLLMYKGLETPEALLDVAGADATAIATQGYGVGNFHLVNGDATRARQVFERVTAGAGWNAFGYIAAEAELARGRQR